MLLREVLLGIVHITVGRRQRRVPENTLQFELVRAVHNCSDGGAMPQQVRVQPRDAGATTDWTSQLKKARRIRSVEYRQHSTRPLDLSLSVRQRNMQAVDHEAKESKVRNMTHSL